ncbi:YcfL family protein [Kerstersia similis]|uniref:YcfL family protein n=1 Tax=Kerstersia similis TaxID=206505 RepID=UPI0039F142E1
MNHTSNLCRIALGIGVLLLAACAQPGRSVSQPEFLMPASPETAVLPDYAASAGIASKLVVPQPMFDLRVVGLRSQRVNDMLTVQAEIANGSSGPRRLFYRFLWLNADGLQSGRDEPWKELPFLGLQNHFVQGMAARPDAVDFRLELRADK